MVQRLQEAAAVRRRKPKAMKDDLRARGGCDAVTAGQTQSAKSGAAMGRDDLI